MKKLTPALLLALLAGACATAHRPPTSPQPAPPPRVVGLTITALDGLSREPIEHVVVTCTTPTEEGRRPDTDGFGRYFLVATEGRQEDCTFTLEGYVTASASWLPGPDSGEVAPVLLFRAIAPPKALRVDAGTHWFVTDDGLADYRELSGFSLLSRMLKGEAEGHVRPWLRQHREIGFNAARVIITLDGDYWREFRSAPDMAGYYEQLDALIDMASREGFYLRLTILGALEPFGGVWDAIARRDIYQGEVRRRAEQFALHIAERVRDRDNVLLELANEPAAIGMKDSSRALRDLGCRVKAIAPARLLDLGDVNGMEFADAFDRCFDFVDRHNDRNSGVAFFEAVKRMGEDPYRDEQPRSMPAMSGEPVNFGEQRRDGRTGDVASSPAVAYAYGAVSRARQFLANFHWDGGLWTTFPQPVTVESMRAFNQALSVFPMTDANRWRGSCSWSLAQGNVWDCNMLPGSDDVREVEDHIKRGRGPWRVYGAGDWGVVFPEPLPWSWEPRARAPLTRMDWFSDGTYGVGIYKRR